MRLAGVDGCKGGWVAAMAGPDGATHAERITRLAELFDRPGAPDLVAIDMPIGLPARIEAKGRAPERLVRPKLGGRQSSVFSIPSRAAVEAALDPTTPEDQRYRHACSASRATSEPPRAISRQAFHIFPKIAELDHLLRQRRDLIGRVHECHPEVSFWAMNGERPLDIAKKVKNAPHEPGLVLRRELLAAQGFGAHLMSRAHARVLGVGADDLIDACAALWTARRIAKGHALRFPEVVENDAEGLPICIQA
ncbi:DUF429 domain-containing protein [Ancylobacter sp. A5.8]|uniref:DUF429 domain-containing protein n=1 Tax=Ancylobacter gelatini TaxID=2919920 RepID=UPI001F4EE425|nr:DUF429 domain-containing protein [Ancylobacter gelatini]MCJ8145181.1 DUF429 domain-containing protein [Ancylobacter gelatini]